MKAYFRIEARISLSIDSENLDTMVGPSKEIKVKYHCP
jgi:hypothetical protein